MAKKKKKANGSITVGDITSSTGVAIGPGASATVNQAGAPQDEIGKAFAAIYEKINALEKSPEKEMV